MNTKLWVVVGVMGLTLAAWGQQPVPPAATAAEVAAGVNRYKYVTPAAIAASGISSNGITAAGAEAVARGSAASGTNTFAGDGSGLSNVVSVAFSETNSAWVSKSGSDSTGTVGKRELPYLTISNAVVAVKTSLGSLASGGTVFVGPGVFAETWLNLQRTNQTGISLIGSGSDATLISQVGSGSLTNQGPLVIVGHSSRVGDLVISNNIVASYKQAAIGYDTTRDVGSTLVVPTNVYIYNVKGVGSSDVGYFYDNGGGDPDITVDSCDWLSKWDALFLNTLSTDGLLRIYNSSIKVMQPDDYNFPGDGSGAGRARAAYVGDGRLIVENSSIYAIGGTATSNETTGLTFSGAFYGWTNINSAIDAKTTGSGAARQVIDGGDFTVLGRQFPALITTNDFFSGAVVVGTSGRDAKATRDGSSLTNLDFAGFSLTTKQAITNAGAGGSGDVTQSGQNNFSGSNFFGGNTRLSGATTISNVTVNSGSAWSLNELTWNYSTGNFIQNFGTLTITNDPVLAYFDFYDPTGLVNMMRILPDSYDFDSRIEFNKIVFASAYGNGGGITNLPVTGIDATGTPSGTTYLRGDGAWATPAGGSGDSYIYTNAAAGGLRFTNEFGLGAFVTGGTASFLTPTGLVTTVSAANTAVYGSQYISYAGVNGIDLATGFTLLDGSDNPALQPQSRVLNGNWNAQGDLDVDGDLNVDGTMTVTDVIVTNLYTDITNATGLGTDADGKIVATATGGVNKQIIHGGWVAPSITASATRVYGIAGEIGGDATGGAPLNSYSIARAGMWTNFYVRTSGNLTSGVTVTNRVWVDGVYSGIEAWCVGDGTNPKWMRNTTNSVTTTNGSVIACILSTTNAIAPSSLYISWNIEFYPE